MAGYMLAETLKNLREKETQMAAGGKQVYDRSALKLTEQQIKDMRMMEENLLPIFFKQNA